MGNTRTRVLCLSGWQRIDFGLGANQTHPLSTLREQPILLVSRGRVRPTLPPLELMAQV